MTLSLVLRRARRAVLGRRRLLAALCAAIAVAAGLRAVAGPPPETTFVVTAARDVPSGTVLRASDLRQVEFIPESVPAGVLDRRAAVGRTTAAPLREGEPLTDVRLVQASILDGYPETVAAPVRIGDADAVRLLRVGDRIDLLAASPQGTEADVIAADVPVVAIPRPDEDSPVDAGALVIVAIPDETVRTVAQSGVSSFISMAIRR